MSIPNQDDEVSRVPTIAPIRGKRGRPPQLTPPPSTLKRPTKTARPRQPRKSKKVDDSKDQDISANLVRTKPYQSNYKPYESETKLYRTDNIVEPTSTFDHGASVSAQTMGKLNVFKYTGNQGEGRCDTYQATSSSSNMYTGQQDYNHISKKTTDARRSVSDQESSNEMRFGCAGGEEKQAGGADGIVHDLFSSILANPTEDVLDVAPHTPTHEAIEELLHLLPDIGSSSNKSGRSINWRGSLSKTANVLPPSQLSPTPRLGGLRVQSPGQAEFTTDTSGINDRAEDEKLVAFYPHHHEMKCDDLMINEASLGSPATNRSPTIPTVEDLLPSSDDHELGGMSDDEFPIDEDMEDMMQLPEMEESFVPPSSLDIPFDDNSQTNEIYDPQLQHSRPPSVQIVHEIYEDGKTTPICAKTTVDGLSSPPTRPSSSYSRDFTPAKAVRDANSLNIDYRDEDFLDDDDEPELLELSAKVSDDLQNASPVQLTLDSTAPKLQWNPPTLYRPTQTPSSSALKWGHTNTMQCPLSSNTSSFSASKAVQYLAPHLIAFDDKGKPLPFVRPPFPKPIRDRSPILGLSCGTVLRTCFRIGEAINAAFAASCSNTEAIIELYARVTYSERETAWLKQHFQFADLFQGERPPFLSGTYDMWKGVELWETDSKVFLGQDGKGRMARVGGRMKRDARSKEWKMLILSVWEAEWADVGFAKGVVCG